jgi:hypothetical protein
MEDNEYRNRTVAPSNRKSRYAAPKAATAIRNSTENLLSRTSSRKPFKPM